MCAMAALRRRLTLLKDAYICDACLVTSRPLRTWCFASTRSFSVASSPNGHAATRPALAQHAQNPIAGRPRARCRPIHASPSRADSLSQSSSWPARPGSTPLPHRRLLALSGPDAAKFLQGLITNNVDSSRDSPLYAAFLDARGRVLWDVFVWVWPALVAEQGHWACYIEVDGSELESLKKHLKRHKLRSKVVIEEVGQDQITVWAAWGIAPGQVDNGHVLSHLADPRAPHLSRYLVEHGREALADGVAAVDVEEYHLRRYEAGIAEGPHEIPRESALPMECNLDLSSGIDFKKGCYVGQELTIRTKHTGVVRKRMLPVQLEGTLASGITIEPGADIKQLDGDGHIKKGRAAGKIVAHVGNVGLALCRLEMMTSMKISAEGGSWKPGMEFGVATENGLLKLKPVLHDWFVLRERNLWDKNRTRI